MRAGAPKRFLFGTFLLRNYPSLLREEFCAGEARCCAMYIGYTRVSTEDQHLEMQLFALRKAGCKKIYQEKVSGKAQKHPALDAALSSLKKGDTLVVWHLDRLGRRACDLINLEYEFKRHGVELISLTQNIDTTTPIGEYHFHVTCANAQLESARISERTKAGMLAARLKGHFPGRPKCLSDRQVKQVRLLSRKKHLPIAAIAERFHVGRTTIWRALHGEDKHQSRH